jgi:hypothetical protein
LAADATILGGKMPNEFNSRNSQMSRLLKLSLVTLGLLLAGAFGYLYSDYRAKDAYGEHFISEAFSREYHEARHDLGIVRLLSENKTDAALQMAQHRYYSRLFFAADIASQSSNPNLRQMLEIPLAEAKEFLKSYPYQFQTEQDQSKWAALIQSPQNK